MKRFIYLLLLGFFLYSASARAQAQNNDFQVWTELKFNHPFEKSRFELQWATENRFRNDGDEYFLFNTTLGFYFKAYSWLSAGFFYRYETIKGKNVFDDFKNEHRLMPQVEFNLPVGWAVLKNRHLFEQRFFEDQAYRFRYRCRFRVQFPIKTKPVSFVPYVSEEIFVETQKGLSQNRAIVGNSFQFLKNHFSFDLYYLLQQVNNGASAGWSNNHILGTSFGIKY